MKTRAIATTLAAVMLFQSAAFANNRRGDDRGGGGRYEDRRDDRRGDRRDDRRHDRRDDRRHDRRDDKISGKDAAIAIGVIGIIGLIAGAAGNTQPAPEPIPDYYDDSYQSGYDRPYEEPQGQKRSVFFNDITRKTGGEWVRILFKKPAYIDFVTVNIIANGLKIHDASLVTTSGRRMALPELIGTVSANSPVKVQSDYIRAGEKVTAIDIRAESMGGMAQVGFSVTSSSETPQIVGVRPAK